MPGEEQRPPAPGIKLPSFKEVQANLQKRAAQVSRFKPGTFAPSGPKTPNPALPASSHPGEEASSSRPRAEATHLPPAPQHAPALAQGHTRVQNTPAALPAPPLAAPQVPQAAAVAKPQARAYSVHVQQGNAILVNKNQTGNPVLRQLRNINYRFADVLPDYQFNDRVRALSVCGTATGAEGSGQPHSTGQ